MDQDHINFSSKFPWRSIQPENMAQMTSGAQENPSLLRLNLPMFVFFGVFTSSVWWIIFEYEKGAELIAASYFIVLAFMGTLMLLRRNMIGALMLVAYLSVLQPAFRAYSPILPYLALEYLVILWAILTLLIQPRRSPLSAPILFYSAYLLLELSGAVFSKNPNLMRGVLVPSSALGFTLLISTRIQINHSQLNNILTAYLIGALNLAMIISLNYLNGATIRWGSDSNLDAAGGMGPNQIASLLGIGVIICIIFFEESSQSSKWLHLFPAAWMALLMLLTFSRTGLALVIIALLIYYGVFQANRLRSFTSLILLSLLGALIFMQVVDVTGQAAVNRYTDLSPTNRLDLARYGWQLFLNNPLLGVGTGNFHLYMESTAYFGQTSGAHNELIRAAAEHGILGIVFWSGFAISSLWLAYQSAAGKARAIRILFLAVCFAYTFTSGLKLMTQPLLLLLAYSALLPEEPEEVDAPWAYPIYRGKEVH